MDFNFEHFGPCRKLEKVEKQKRKERKPSGSGRKARMSANIETILGRARKSGRSYGVRVHVIMGDP